MHEMDQSQAMFTLAEAVGDVVHSVNNHLNSLLLQGACLQMTLTGEARQQLEAMRAEAKKAAYLLRALQVVRPWPYKEGERADAVEAVRGCDLGEDVPIETPAEPVLVAGSAMGLRRLAGLLIRLACRAVRDPNRPTVDVNAERLRIVMPGVTLDADDEGKPALAVEAGPGLPELEQKAARWMARQMGRRLEYEAIPGGAALAVRW